MWFNIYGHFFFYKIYENYDVISQKVWRHCKNDPTEQILL